MSLSVVVITKNEEAVIRRCLESVAWADEIVVVDSGSTDRTVDICREMGAQVSVTRDWPGFGRQKNRGLELARGEWVLSIDADEWVTPELAKEMAEVLRQPAHCAAYEIPRRSSFCGRWMRHSGWWPDYLPRLFRRGKARFSEDLLHERIIVDGPVQRLSGELLHESFANLEEVLSKIDSYSTWGAQTLAAKGRRASLAKAIAHGLWTFLRTYILRAGFLDGREGFMLAVSNAEGTYYKYLKLCVRPKQRPRQ